MCMYDVHTIYCETRCISITCEVDDVKMVIVNVLSFTTNATLLFSFLNTLPTASFSALARKHDSVYKHAFSVIHVQGLVLF